MADELNWRQRKRVFLAALEILDLARGATVGGVTRKLEELAAFVGDGGKLKPGVLFVNSERKSNHTWLDWAADFFSCMPDNARAKHKLVAAYTAGEEDGRQSGGVKRQFWKRVRERGLDKSGLAIAGRM